MSKQELINKIQEITSEHGYITLSEIENVEAPIFQQVNKDHHSLIEGFSENDITVVEYIHEIEVSSNDISYTDLTEKQLKEVLEILNKFVEQQP